MQKNKLIASRIARDETTTKSQLLDTTVAHESAISFLSSLGLNTNQLKNVGIRTTEFNPLTNIFYKMKIQQFTAIGGAAILAWPIDTFVSIGLGLTATMQAANYLYRSINPKSYQLEYAASDLRNNKIETNMTNKEQDIFSSILVHELVHFLGKFRVIDNRLDLYLARALEIDCLVNSRHIASIQEATSLIESYEDEKHYSLSNFIAGFESKSPIRSPLIKYENYRISMQVAGRRFRLINQNPTNKKLDIRLLIT